MAEDPAPPAPRHVHLSVEDAQLISAHFDLGAVQEVTLAARGWVSLNVVWRIATSTGVWAVKEITRDDAPTIESAIEIELGAADAGIGIAPVVLTEAGRAAVEIEGRRFRCHGFVEGDVPTSSLTLDDAEQAGRALGTLHALDLPWAPHLMVPTVFGLDDWNGLIDDGEESGATWVDILRMALPAILAAESEAEAWASAPRRWVGSHRDVRPDNTIRSDGRLVFVDWDGAGPIVAEVEVAGALRWWHPHEDGFLRAYTEAAGEVDLSVGRGENGGLIWWLHTNVEHALAAPADGERAWAVTALAANFIGR